MERVKVITGAVVASRSLLARSLSLRDSTDWSGDERFGVERFHTFHVEPETSARMGLVGPPRRSEVRRTSFFNCHC